MPVRIVTLPSVRTINLEYPDAANNITLDANDVGAAPFAVAGESVAGCVHNGTNYPTRPSGHAFVVFVGPTDPAAQGGLGVQNGDAWIDNS